MTGPISMHARFGPTAQELGWVPAPSYLLRRARILSLLKDREPGRLLEIGPGAGALLLELSEKGYRGSALETSASARELASHFLAGAEGIEMRAEPAEEWARAFDLVMAFEVLEHIRDDLAALRRWRGWLAEGGRLLLSVPAHARMWSRRDEWAGHFRRYERSTLVSLIEQAGLAVERLECYGFPLGNLLRYLGILATARQQRVDASALVERTARSGVERKLETRLFRFQAHALGVFCLVPFLTLQNHFLERDLGVGYLLECRLP